MGDGPPRGRGSAKWDRDRFRDQALGKKYFLMLSPSVLNITPVPRSWRICFLVRLIMPWRLPAEAYITLPVPVTLKRFFAPDLVFSLGIWLSCWPRNASQRPGSPAYARNERVLEAHKPSPRQPFSRA